MSVINLGAQLLHENIQRIILNGILVTPDSVDDRVSLQDTARIAHHEFEDEKLRPRQIDLSIPAARGMRDGIQG